MYQVQAHTNMWHQQRRHRIPIWHLLPVHPTATRLGPTDWLVRQRCTAYGSFSATGTAIPVPNVPVNFKATRYSSTSINLKWSGVSGASGYVIYRATSSQGTYSLLKTTTSLYYKNTGLVTGRTYYYKIKAYRTVGTKKVYSNWSALSYGKP